MTEIRQVDSGDWRAVRDVRLAGLKDAPDWFWATYDDEVDKSEGWWRDFIGKGAWFLAYEGGHPVGVAAAISSPELKESDRQLISMWVAPGARRRGIGAELVEAVKSWARESGVRELHLEVTDTNVDAARLYQRCGFRYTGQQEPHPRNVKLAEVEMRLRL